MTHRQPPSRDALEALHPLPRAIALDLATAPGGGMWLHAILSTWQRAGEREDLIRLAVATLVDAGFAASYVPGRVSLTQWACETLRLADEPIPLVVTRAGRAFLAEVAR